MDSEKTFQGLIVAVFILAALVGLGWAGYYYQQQQVYSQPEQAYLQGYSDGAADGFAAIVEMNREDERQETIRAAIVAVFVSGAFCVCAIVWLFWRVLRPGKADGNG